MSRPAFEEFLVKLYTDREVLRRFLDDPRAEGRRAGLNERECEDLARADTVGLQFAARSFSAKRARKKPS